MAVTDLPQPLSPTRGDGLAGVDGDGRVADGVDVAAAGLEGEVQAVDVQERVGHGRAAVCVRAYSRFLSFGSSASLTASPIRL